MKIELRNIKHSPSLSEETNAFTADVYIDGKKVGFASNRGCGGSTDIHPYQVKDSVSANRELLEQADKFCKTMPPVKTENFTIDMDLEFYIDEIISADLKKKEIEKTIAMLNRIAKKKWVIISKEILTGLTNGTVLNIVWSELKSTIAPGEMTSEMFEKVKAEVQKRCEGDEIVYNTSVLEKLSLLDAAEAMNGAGKLMVDIANDSKKTGK